MSSSIELPVIDISQPLSSTALSSLYNACKEWGFFYIINHGVSKQLFKKVHSQSNELFNLPCETKLKVGPSSSFEVKTYTPHFVASPFFESFRVDGPDFAGSAQETVDVLFEDSNSDFSSTMKEYGTKMTELSKTIIKLILKSMGNEFDKKFNESEFSNCHGYLRINKYSPPQQHEQEGLGKHTDMSCVTIVNQDDVGGLQVRPSPNNNHQQKWMDIKPNEDTLVVNVGDLLHAWSNGRLRSSEHRVVLNKGKGKGKGKGRVSRFSVAFFWCFEDEKIVYSPDEVVGGLRVFKEFVCGEYVKFRESSGVDDGFEKVGFTVKDFAGIC